MSADCVDLDNCGVTCKAGIIPSMQDQGYLGLDFSANYKANSK